MSGPDLLRLLSGPVLTAAPRLLGARLTHAGVVGEIIEVEAYDGAADPGSHAYRGQTPRNRSMFDRPGCLYVYFTYGMHHSANVVCGEEGRAAAVLLRAARITSGRELARSRRPGAGDRELARGPARLCRAFGIDRTLDGTDLIEGPVLLRLADQPVPDELIATGPRVGLRQAAERPWRFWIRDEPTVSGYRPAAARPRRS